MFTLLMRKMRNTKWMVLCLLIGFIMAAAMTSTIPIYMNASLQRMLVKDMENFQTEEGVFPGTYETKHSVTLDVDTAAQRTEIDKIQALVDENYDSLGCPASFSKTYIADEYLYVTSIAITDGSSAARLTLGGMTGLEEAAEIVRGRMFQKGQRSDGVYECVTTEKALKVSELATDTVYEIGNIFGADKTVKIEIVGVIDVKDGYEAYWAEGLGEYLSTVFADYDTLYGDIMDTGAVNISNMAVRYAIDYPHMNMNTLGLVNDRIEDQRRIYEDNDVSFKIPAANIFIDYADRASQLRETLWLLQIPVILMILVYLFMVSQLNVEQEKNEIAVFKSRGASRGQIIRIYALESMFLGVVSAAAAPFVGMALCRMLGASNGFLEFVNRKSLPITLAADAFIYSAAAVVVFFFTTMTPIVPSTKTTIVEHKQSKAKKRRLPLWEKLCADFILIGGSLGWLYYYTKKQADLTAEGMTDREAAVNPMMFIASAAFIVGCGLFIIRIHPLIIRIFSKLLQRVLSPAAYVSFNNIGRSAAGKERFLMIFLILTVSLGLYFANTARALNRNAEERVSYGIGADVVMKEEWSNTSGELRAQSAAAAGDAALAARENGTQLSAEEAAIEVDEDSVEYTEPPIERFEQLSGVESVARVFIRNPITVSSSRMKVPKVSKVKEEAQRKELWDEADSARTTNSTDNVNLMAIDPGEFSKVCWFADRLLPYHINEYLNALSEYPQGILLSSAFMNTYGLKTGDTVTVSWGGNDPFEATVLAFIDFWPSMNPYLTAKDGSYMNFAVMNLDYVKIMSKIEPYQVWIKLEDGALTEDLYKSIEDSDIEPTVLRVANQEIITEKNDPMLQGMNGALTLGFIIIMIMCIIGFLMYWILSIKSRTLQFGILRAMGMKYREIIAMILYEQLLTSGAAILSAIFIGGVASELYVPLFQYLYTAEEQVPGFVVIPQRADYLKVYSIILVMLLICFIVLGSLIRRINISKALKLGED